MFSYRHAFHAGNHADVLKHITLLSVLRYMAQKEAPLYALDSHAGAGLYRLDSDYAQTSGEAANGYLKLLAASQTKGTVAPALQDYLALVASFNPGRHHNCYPGSPFIIWHVLQSRQRDRLKLFELHPVDSRTLAANVAQLQAQRRIAVLAEDGFAGLKKFLPPPSRRALVLCDPSYEIKSDYVRLPEMLLDALQRFASGTYLLWYPIIGQHRAHDLPRKLKTLVKRQRLPWLNATLSVQASQPTFDPAKGAMASHTGLSASGVFVINPPYTLKAALEPALAQASQWLAPGKSSAFELEVG